MSVGVRSQSQTPSRLAVTPEHMDTQDLTDRQREVLSIITGDDDSEPGASTKAIANQLGVKVTTARDHLSACKKVGVRKNETDGKWYMQEADQPDDHRRAEEIAHTEVAEVLRDNGTTIDTATDALDTSPEIFKNLLDAMRREGYSIDFDIVDSNGTRRYYLTDDTDKRFKIADGDGHYCFAIISDTHLGSSAEHLDELHNFYDRCVERGITNVFHAGDISDGWEVHKGHINVIKSEAAGWDRLKEYVIENYPRREGITTHFIEGNHDHKFHRRTGLHFGELLAQARDDLHYCGDSQATFIFDRENDIDLELIHPSGGKPYTTGYRLQTLYRERSIDSRPTIAAVGHIHGSMYAETEGVKGLYAGAWKGTTTYGKRKGHEAKIGGWIIDMDIKDGSVTQFVPQWQGYEEQGTANIHDVTDMTE